MALAEHQSESIGFTTGQFSAGGIGVVIQFFRNLENTLAGGIADTDAGDVVQDE
jgi:hypothetical protein